VYSAVIVPEAICVLLSAAIFRYITLNV